MYNMFGIIVVIIIIIAVAIYYSTVGNYCPAGASTKYTGTRAGSLGCRCIDDTQYYDYNSYSCKSCPEGSKSTYNGTSTGLGCYCSSASLYYNKDSNKCESCPKGSITASANIIGFESGTPGCYCPISSNIMARDGKCWTCPKGSYRSSSGGITGPILTSDPNSDDPRSICSCKDNTWYADLTANMCRQCPEGSVVNGVGDATGISDCSCADLETKWNAGTGTCE
jgi:hypothetical protein